MIFVMHNIAKKGNKIAISFLNTLQLYRLMD